MIAPHVPGSARIAARFVVAGMVLSMAACSSGPAPTAAPSANPSAPATSEPSEAASPPSPSAAKLDVPGGLGDALAFADVTTRSVTFGDWAAIKSTLGASEITSTNTLEEKFEALRGLVGGRDVLPTESLFRGFGVNYLRNHVDVWGFDAMDLDWDALIVGEALPMWVLRFREGFDFARFHARLDDYGFSTEQVPLGVLRSTDAMFSTTYTDAGGQTIPLVQTTELQIANTAFLADGRTVVMYADLREAPAGAVVLRRLLTDGFGGPLDLSLESVARLLDEPFTAELRIGADTCTAFRGQPKAPEVRVAMDALLAEAGALGHYNALGIGYSREHDPIGRVVMGYADAAEGLADLAGRRLLVERGIESHGRPYSDALFTLGDARVEERAVVVDLALVNDSARNIVSAAIHREMLFASC